MAVRVGTGKLVKYFKGEGDTMKGLMEEVNELTDKDVSDLVSGLENGSMTY